MAITIGGEEFISTNFERANEDLFQLIQEAIEGKSFRSIFYDCEYRVVRCENDLGITTVYFIINEDMDNLYNGCFFILPVEHNTPDGKFHNNYAVMKYVSNFITFDEYTPDTAKIAEALSQNAATQCENSFKSSKMDVFGAFHEVENKVDFMGTYNLERYCTLPVHTGSNAWLIDNREILPFAISLLIDISSGVKTLTRN